MRRLYAFTFLLLIVIAYVICNYIRVSEVAGHPPYAMQIFIAFILPLLLGMVPLLVRSMMRYPNILAIYWGMLLLLFFVNIYMGYYIHR
jgi:hypothetical protein